MKNIFEKHFREMQMYSPINEKLEQARQNVYRLHKNNSELFVLKNELTELENAEKSLKLKTEKEDKEFEKISGRNVSTLFYSVLGSLEKQVEKERQEALSARLHYNQCLSNLADIREKIQKIETDNQNYLNAEAEFEKLYAAKEELLRKDNGSAVHQIMELEEKIERNKYNLKEIEEAFAAGADVLECLDKALDYLNSASDWGVWDMLGGGLITTAIKHSRIDDAAEAVEDAQNHLRSFNAELADIEITDEICFDTNGMLKMADFFLDGLIFDWFMQSKINASADSVYSVKKQVLNAMDKLEELENAEKKIISELEAEMKKIICET